MNQKDPKSEKPQNEEAPYGPSPKSMKHQIKNPKIEENEGETTIYRKVLHRKREMGMKFGDKRGEENERYNILSVN